MASATDTHVVCVMPFISDEGTFQAGQEVRHDHPAVTKHGQFFRPAATLVEEWPTPFERGIRGNRAARVSE